MRSAIHDGEGCLSARSASGDAVVLSDDAVLDLVEALVRVSRMPTPAPYAG